MLGTNIQNCSKVVCHVHILEAIAEQPIDSITAVFARLKLSNQLQAAMLKRSSERAGKEPKVRNKEVVKRAERRRKKRAYLPVDVIALKRETCLRS